MYQNFRLFFSLVWLLATGCLLASGIAVIVTLGGYLDFFYASLGAWCLSTLGTIVTSA